jgi:hypothetical protein
METYDRAEVKLHSFLTSVADGGDQSDSRVSFFIPETVWTRWRPEHFCPLTGGGQEPLWLVPVYHCLLSVATVNVGLQWLSSSIVKIWKYNIGTRSAFSDHEFPTEQNCNGWSVNRREYSQFLGSVQ